MDSNASLINISDDVDTLLSTSPLHRIAITSSPLRLQIPNNPLSISSPPLSLSSITTTTTTTTSTNKGDLGSQVHGSASIYCNKENVNNNECKLVVPNLSVEPQKMKRSKRAGGYNLRKSMAWDRAFFTEEGVLNDSELSMITGCDRDSLCVIDEQASNMLPTQSTDMSGYSSKRSYTTCSSMKQASIPRSTQKFSPNQGLKKVVSKEVCSSPMASTAQKRLFQSTRKMLTRNSKIPKVQVSKKNTLVQSMAAIQSGGVGSNLKSCGIPQSANVETLDEVSSRKSPSGYPDKRNATSSSFTKQDASYGSGPASVSRSTQKVSSGHDLKKAACKEVCSTPKSPIPQKLLLNSTRKILTRNSKTPKVQSLKKNPPVQSMTPLQSAAGGSSLKSSGIPQPVARKNLCSKLSSTIKRASSAAKTSLESMPKSIKPSADVGNEVISSTLQTCPLMSHKATNKTTESKRLENNPIQERLNAEAAILKSSVGRSTTTATSYVQADTAGLGLSRKSIEVQGNKPSGLRMPSPSLRFFSETKSPVSNISSQTNSMPLKVVHSSIPTSRNPIVVDHTCDLKPIQISEQALNNVDPSPTNKAEACSQRTDNYSTSSIVIPKMHAKVTQDNGNEQEVEVGVPVGCDDSKSSNDEQFRYDNLDVFELKCKDEVPTSVKVKGQDCKDNRLTSCHVDIEEESRKATILFLENRTDRSMLDGSCESCPEVQLIADCESREIQSQVVEDVECNSLATDNDVTSESQTDSTSLQNILMLALDVDCRKTHDESSSGDLDLINFERSMEMQPGGRNLSVQGTLEEDSAVPGCLSGVLVVSESTVHDNVTGICNDNIIVADSFKCKPAEGEQGDIMFDSKVSNLKLCKSSEAQHGAFENCDTRKRNDTNFNDYDHKGSCNVSFEIGKLGHPASTLPEVSNEHHVEFNHICESAQGEEQRQVYRHGVVESCASVDDASITYEQCSEFYKGYTEIERSQILNNEADLNYSIIARESFCETDQGENKVRISDGLDRLNNSAEEVKGHINLLINLPNFDDGSTHQTTHLEFQSIGMRSQDQVIIAVAEPNTEEILCPVNELITPPGNESVRATVEECTESDKLGCNLAPRETDESTCNTECIYDNASTHQFTHLKLQSTGMMNQDQVVISVADPDIEESLCPVNGHAAHPSIELRGATVEGCIESDIPGWNLAPRETDESTCNTEGIFDDGSIHQTTHPEFESAGVRGQHPVVISVADLDTKLLCPVNEHVMPSRIESTGAILEEYIESVGENLQKGIESDRFECNLVRGETDESTCNTEDIYDEGASTKQTDDQTLVRPPPTAIPFSDEWLAAIESAGEEILTLKTGAVKHSPPDKSIPEPSPWSPVKRKTNQAIGPFDCTKYTHS